MSSRHPSIQWDAAVRLTVRVALVRLQPVAAMAPSRTTTQPTGVSPSSSARQACSLSRMCQVDIKEWQGMPLPPAAAASRRSLPTHLLEGCTHVAQVVIGPSCILGHYAGALQPRRCTKRELQKVPAPVKPGRAACGLKSSVQHYRSYSSCLYRTAGRVLRKSPPSAVGLASLIARYSWSQSVHLHSRSVQYFCRSDRCTARPSRNPTVAMDGAGRRLGILQQHLAALDIAHNAGGSAALTLGLCRAAAAAAAGPPVLVGGAVMDLQASSTACCSSMRNPGS